MDAEELRRRILGLFADGVESDPEITRLFAEIQTNGTYQLAEDVAWRVGGKLSAAFEAVTQEFPEVITETFADTLLREPLRGDHKIIADATQIVQDQLNRKAGLGLKALSAPLYEGRIDGFVKKLASYEQVKDGLWVLGDSIRTFSQSIVDDTVRVNAEFQMRAGLRPRIIRRDNGGCCEWCARLAGVYEYPDVPKDVYRRHANCRCTVEYDPGTKRLRQNVWTKEWTTEAERSKIEAIKKAVQDAFMESIVEHPARLEAYTPASLKKEFERQGYTV